MLEGQHARWISFYEKLRDLSESMPANEVQFYLKRAEFDSMCSQNAIDMDKSLRKMRERVTKHLCSEAGLLGVVWERTVDDLVSMYTEFECLAKKCYDGVGQLSPSSTALRTMATALAQSGADAIVKPPAAATSGAPFVQDEQQSADRRGVR